VRLLALLACAWLFVGRFAICCDNAKITEQLLCVCCLISKRNLEVLFAMLFQLYIIRIVRVLYIYLVTFARKAITGELVVQPIQCVVDAWEKCRNQFALERFLVKLISGKVTLTSSEFRLVSPIRIDVSCITDPYRG